MIKDLGRLFGGGRTPERIRLIAEASEWKLKFAAHQSKPRMCFKNVNETLMSKLQPVHPNNPCSPQDIKQTKPKGYKQKQAKPNKTTQTRMPWMLP